MAYDLTAVLKLRDEMSSKLKGVTKALGGAKKATDTFRDSQGRLRDAQGRFAKSTGGASKSLGSFTSNTQTATGAVGNLVTALGSAIGTAKLLDATLGEAMRYEQSTITIDAMFNNEKLSKEYTKMLEQFAIDSPLLNSSDMFANSKSFINLTSDIDQLEQMWNLSERLLAVDTKQGVDGAVLALRELFSGDTQSLVERFEMPRKALNDIKNLPINEQLAELDKLFNEMNMTNHLVERMGDSSLGVINRIKEALSMKFRNAGLEALEQLKPIILDIEKAVSGGALDGFFNALTKGFGIAATEAAKFSDYIKTNWPTIKENFNSTKDALAPMGEALGLLYDGVKKVGDYMVQNWSYIQPVVVGLAYAFAGLKVIGTVTTIVRALAPVLGIVTKTFRILSTAVKVARVAFTAIRLAMMLFPGAWIIRIIGLVVTAGIALWKNWDTIKAKAAEMWPVIVEKFKVGVEWVKTKATELRDALVTKVQNAITTVVTFFQGLPEKIAYWLGYAVGRATVWMALFPQKASEFFSQMINNASNWLSQLPGRISNYLSNAYNKSVEWLSNIAGKFKEWFTTAVDNATNIVKELPGKIADFLAQIPGKASAVIGDVWAKFKELGAAIPRAIGDGIQSAMGGLNKIAKWALDKLASGVSNLSSMGSGLISSFGAGARAGMVDGSHYHGLSRVPYDGYIARLHKGEEIVPRQQADQYRANRSGGGSVINLNIAYNGGAMDEQQMAQFGDFLVRRLSQATSGGA